MLVIKNLDNHTQTELYYYALKQQEKQPILNIDKYYIVH